jgi:hypothetical protein
MKMPDDVVLETIHVICQRCYNCRHNVILDAENQKVYKQPSSEEQPVVVQYSDSEKFFDNALEKSLTNESR